MNWLTRNLSRYVPAAFDHQDGTQGVFAVVGLRSVITITPRATSQPIYSAL